MGPLFSCALRAVPKAAVSALCGEPSGILGNSQVLITLHFKDLFLYTNVNFTQKFSFPPQVCDLLVPWGTVLF